MGDDAIAINTQILKIDDRVVGAYTRLARCFRQQGNWLAARSMYQQVLAVDSNNQIAVNQLAVIEEKMQDLDDLDLVGTIQDHNAAFAIGVAARRQGRGALAVSALKRAVELNPTDYSLTALGAAFRSIGRLAEAEATYRRAISMSDSLAAQVGLAAVFADRGWLTDAHRMYWNVLRADNRNVYALNGLGAVLLRRGRLEQAERCFVRSAEIGEVTDESHARLVELCAAYVRCGDVDGERRVEIVLDRLAAIGRPSRP